MNTKYTAFPVGLTVKDVRLMTKVELEEEGWEESWGGYPVVLIFNDGSKVYASSDPEGNDAGTLFGVTGKGNMVQIAPLSGDMIPESQLDN